MTHAQLTWLPRCDFQYSSVTRGGGGGEGGGGGCWESGEGHPYIGYIGYLKIISKTTSVFGLSDYR